MEWIDAIANTSEITLGSSLFKIFFSVVAGGAIGMERKWRHQPAGFRTQLLICLGSTLIMILSLYIPREYLSYGSGDPGRIAAQIVTGIGFLGAGAILKMGTNVRGLTTAASIWVVAAIGMTIGAGLYLLALVVTLIVLFALKTLERLERRIFTDFSPRYMIIITDNEHIVPRELLALFQEKGLKTLQTEITHDLEKEECDIRIGISLDKDEAVLEELFQTIKSIKGVKKIQFA